MSHEFLSRWSRLKRGAMVQARLQSEPQSKDSTSPTPAPDAAPAIELSSLPAIESINAESNVAVFLQAGVPEGLTRAALRSAWASDPAIRDFVGVADNQWDFNGEGTIPGFGPLSAAECARYVAAWTLRGAATTPADGNTAPIESGGAISGNDSTDGRTGSPASTPVSQHHPIPRVPGVGSQARTEPSTCELQSSSTPPPPPNRTHGSALPK